MRNKRLFVLISIVLVLSLVFAGCGKSSDVKDNEIEDKNTIAEDEQDIFKVEDDHHEDVEDIDEEEESETPINKSDLDKPVSSKAQNKSEPNNDTNKYKSPEVGKKPNISTDEKSSSAKTETDKKSSVTIVIIGPKDVGTILSTTEVGLNEGDTVFDILKQVVKDNNIQMEYKGRKSSVYIQGIHNIYEFDNGPESGWIYRVNGEVSQSSCGAHKLKNGDKIEWLYTTDLGREFGAKGGGK